jgi:hypothetical protein
MSDFQPAPAAPTPAAPALPTDAPAAAPDAPPASPPTPQPPTGGDAGGQGSEWSLHPSWDKTFEETFAEAGIPDMLQPKVREKIAEKLRLDEAAVQRQIEAARGNVPPEWRSLLEEARAAGVTPKQLVDSYFAVEQLRTDPIAFQQQLNQEIDTAVEKGILTRAQGEEAKRQVDDAGDTFDLDADNPLAKKLSAVEQKLAEQEAREQQRQQEIEAQQAEQAETQWAESFFATVQSSLNAATEYAPLMSDPAMAAQAQTLQITVARLAGSLMDANPSFTEAQAINGAIDQLRSVGAVPKAAAPVPPVQAGSSAVPGQAPQKLTENDREAAMLAEALRWVGQ